MVSEAVDVRTLEEREKIVRRAQDLFFTHGFSRVTTEEIARELGISKKTLYAHFETKEDLLRAAVHSFRDEMRESVQRVLESRSASVIDKLAGVLSAVGAAIARVRPPFTAEIQRKAPELWQELEEFRLRYVLSEIERLFLLGSRKGVLRKDIDPHVFLQMFLSVVRTILTPEAISHLSLSAAEAFRTILTVLLTGVLTDEARERFAAIQTIEVHR